MARLVTTTRLMEGNDRGYSGVGSTTSSEVPLRQLLYASMSTSASGRADLPGILETSRHNNAIDGITGLLWSDGTRFIQALEGPEASVEQTFSRIAADPRHDEVTLLSDRVIDHREFGSWSMEHRSIGAAGDQLEGRVERLLINAPDTIRARFREFAAGA